jgi:MFS family permease
VTGVGTAERIFGRAHRATTAGLLLVMTLAAYEEMAVSTAMPRAVAALHGLAYYGWPFTAYLVANVVGIVTGGELCDRGGPRRPLLIGLGIFTAGLFVSGSAPLMAAFVGGRAVQGLGSGFVIVAIYVVIAEVYDDRLRPKMFAALSAAWVLPSLVGPVVSGALTEHLTWRLVFLLIPPFTAAGAGLVLPVLRRLPAHPRAAAATRLTRWRFALLAAVGIALLEYAGQRITPLSLVPLAVGAVLVVPALRVLLPAGTIRARPRLPAVIAFRGISAGAFFAVDAYVPLTLTRVHAYQPTAAGVPLMIGSLGWSAASWWQGRHADMPRHRYLRVGFTLVAVAAVGMAAVAVPVAPGYAAYAIWLVGGAGMGLVMPSVSVLTLQLSPEAERGYNSSALQIADVMTSAVCIGAGGVLVAAAEHGRLSLGHAIGAVDLIMCLFALVGVALAGRVAAARGRS